MKQLFFLLLFPCFALAQYQGNAGQKITLGEQTTADGLVYRGVASIDTVTATSKITRANKQDTSAYLLLDTVTNLLWHYKIGSNAWTQAGGGVSVSSFSAGSTGLTPSTATTGEVTLGGTLAVANGGTGATSLSPNNYLIRTNSSGVFDTSAVYEIGGNVGIGTASPTYKLDVNGTSRFSNTLSVASNANAGTIEFGTGTFKGVLDYSASTGLYKFNNQTAGGGTTNYYQFQADGTSVLNIKKSGATTFSSLAGSGDRAVVADANGLLSAPISSIMTKENVQALNYGLNEILQINPVSFDYIDKNKWGEERNLGFIVEDMYPIVPEVTGTMNNGDMYLDMTKLIPILTKAIQEQQALIKELEQRILNLENK